MYLKAGLSSNPLASRDPLAWRSRAVARILLFTGSVVLIGMVSASHAQSPIDEDFDDQHKPWQEIAAQFPAAPLEENLLPFDVSATTAQSFAIDEKSLMVGPDGVVRYTMVAKSLSGAKTVSYEGIRCQSFEKKLYAFGHAEGSWSRSRRDSWEPIARNAANRQHAVLAMDYLCENRVVA